MEDAAAELEVKVGDQRPNDVLIPRLLELFKVEHQEAKCLAVAVVNMLAVQMPGALVNSLDA